MAKSKLTASRVRTIGVGVCVVFFFLGGVYTAFSINQYIEEKEKRDARQRYLTQLIKDITILKGFITKYESEKEKFEEILFTDKDVATFLEDISRFAHQAQVNILSMRTRKSQAVRRMDEIKVEREGTKKKKAGASKKKEEEKRPKMLALPIDIKVAGEFEPLVDFLVYLEKHRQLITLSDVEIRVRKYPLLECSFILKIYSMQELMKKEES